MAVHYNAFISYNHNPRDMKIAALLQQKLEHFRAPMRVKTADEIPEIKRVFLDKGELGVSTDLNEEIQIALQNSDYLIVICSPESNASVWVHREIGFFLRNHTVDKILTVITAGEPSEVLPEEILTKEIVEEDGTVRTESREPLSCDYRLPVKQANKVELPRLVAAILGIRYDDLMQRQRHYRMVRAAAIGGTAFVLMLIAIGYLIWSNHRIKENYENTLREQSRALALQSEQALNDGDRPLAIEYALKALPSEGVDRPIVSEAVYALASAEGIYQSPDDSWLTSLRSYYDFEPFSYFEDKDGIITRLVGFQNGRLKVIDVASGEDLIADYGKELETAAVEFYAGKAYGESRLLLLTSAGFKCYDLSEGREVWTTALDEYGTATGGIFPYKDSLWVPIKSYDTEIGYRFTMLEVEASSGKVLRSVPLTDSGWVGDGFEQSADGRYVAYWSSYYSDETSYTQEDVVRKDTVTVFDAEQASTAQWETDAFTVDAAFSKDNTLVICQIEDRPALSDGFMDGSGIFEYNLRNRRKYFTISSEHATRLTGFSPGSFEKRWSRTYREMCNGIPYLDVRTDLPSGSPDIYCTAGNILHVLDQNGKEAFTVHFASPVIAYHLNGSEDVSAVLHSGQFAAYTVKSGDLTQAQFFSAPVMDAIAKNGTFFIYCPYGDNFGKYKLLQYRADAGDPSWQEYPVTDMSVKVFSYKDSFIEVPRYPDVGDPVTARDVVTGEVLWSCSLPKPEYDMISYYRKTNLDEATGQVVIITGVYTDYYAKDSSKRYKLCYLTIDAASGEMQTREVMLACPDPKWSGFFNELDIDNGKIYLLGSESYYDCEAFYLETVDIAAGTASVAELQNYQSTLGLTEHTSQMYSAVALAKEDTLLIRVNDPESGESILVYNTDGTQRFQTTQAEAELLEMTVFEGDVFTLAKDGQGVHIIIYNGADGNVKEDHVVSGLEAPEGSKRMRFDVIRVSENEIVLQLFNAGCLINTADWAVTADLNGFEAYNESTNELYLSGSASGHVPLRTLDDMIALGNELLKKKE